MKPPVSIFFDTSALRALGWSSSPLLTVLQLAKAGLIEVHLPELVVLERQSQWAEEPAQALLAARMALRNLTSNPMIAPQHAEQVQRVLKELEALDIQEMAVTAIEQFLSVNRINQLPLTLEQSQAAWKAYFEGTPPHRQAKTRDDIPDAHIFEAARTLLRKQGEVNFVCADKRLAGALEALPGAKVYATLVELFQSKVLAEATHLWSRDQQWRRVQYLASVDDIKAELKEQLEDDIDEQLRDLDFTDLSLPGSAVAHVQWASGGELIEIQNPDDWGGGILSFEVDCECDAGIRMRFSHDEARGLPDWIDVEWGNGPFVDATANVRLKVETTVDVELNLLNVERNQRPLLSRADFNDAKLFILKT